MTTKSKCQMRLEKRWSQELKSVNALEATLNLRLAQAQANRLAHTTHRQKVAQRRLRHVQQVVRQQQVERVQKHRLLCNRLDHAAQKRRAQLSKRQQLCRQRLQQIDQRVQVLKQTQHCKRSRQRQAIEQQLCSAERRREIQQQQLVERLSQRWQSVEQVKDRIQSVKAIQQWYRNCRRTREQAEAWRKKTSHVHSIVECWSAIASSTFEESMMLLQRHEVSKAAQELVQVLRPRREGHSKEKPSPRSNAFRVFLMAGMIASHPNEIMQQQHSDSLVFAARTLRKTMIRLSTCLNAHELRQLRRIGGQMCPLFEYYVECFDNWKRLDAERLASEMLGSYQQIYITKVHYELADADNTDDGMHQLRDQTDKQLSQLKNALTRVIGREDAHRRIQAVERKIRDQMIPDIQEPDEEVTDSSSSDVEADDTDDLREKSALAMESSEFLRDEQLVHELILNPEFQFSAEIESDFNLTGKSAFKQIRDTRRRAFWDHLVQSNDISALLSQFDEFSQSFRSVLGNKCQSLVNDVQQALDVRELSEMLSTGKDASDLLNKSKWRLIRVLECIVLLEAAARNESTREFMAKLNDIAAPHFDFRVYVDFLAFAYRKLDELRVDLANFHLSVLATHLKNHGVDYEQRKLAEKLSTGMMRLSKTEKWLARSLQSVVTTLSASDMTRLRAFDSDQFSRVVRAGFLLLVEVYIQEFGRSDSDLLWPESFALDVNRIRSIRNAMDKVVVIACVLALLQEYSTRRHFKTTHAHFRQVNDTMMTLLDAEDLSGVDLIAQVVHEAERLEQDGDERTSSSTEMLLELEERAKSVLFNDKNVLFRLFRSRVYSTLTAVILGDKEVTSSVHPSLRAYESLLREQWQVALRLVKHNEVVYATQYNCLIKQLLEGA